MTVIPGGLLYGPESPSVRDGIKQEELLERQREAAKFIMRVASFMEFPCRTMSTAVHLLFAFYSVHSLRDFPVPNDIALTAIFLACKIEETFKKIKDILEAAFRVSNPQHMGEVEIPEELRMRVVMYEDEMLQAIEYNFNRPCPFYVLARVCRTLKLKQDTMLLAWDTLLKLHLEPLVSEYPLAYLCVACIISARLSMGKDVEHERDLAGRLGLRHDTLEALVQRIK